MAMSRLSERANTLGGRLKRSIAAGSTRPQDRSSRDAAARTGIQARREEAVAEVMRCYRAILGRPADESAIAHYVPSVQNGSLSLPEVCAELVH